MVLVLDSVISALRRSIWDWVALLTGRLWLVTYARHYRKLLTQEEGPEISSEVVTKVVMVGCVVRDH